MVCPKCNSQMVTTQVVTDMSMRNAHHGIFWWLFVSWWWIPFKWIFLTIPALLAKIFIPSRKKVVTTQKTMCVCQNCGNTWTIK